MTHNPILPPRSKFESRKDFLEVIGDMLTHSGKESETMVSTSDETRGRPPELKTYIMKSNNIIPNIEAVSTLDARQIPTNLSKISILELKYNNKLTYFYVDSTDPRLLVLYSNELAEDTDLHFERLVNSTSNKFDKTWFPTETLDEN